MLILYYTVSNNIHVHPDRMVIKDRNSKSPLRLLWNLDYMMNCRLKQKRTKTKLVLWGVFAVQKGLLVGATESLGLNVQKKKGLISLRAIA